MVRPTPDLTREATIAAALEALQANRPLRAEETCRDYLGANPGSVEHLRLLGHALTKQARYVEAEQTVRLAISLKPGFPHLHEDLGSVFALQQRFAEAVPCFEEAIRLEPQLPLAHKKLGQALAALGRGREADAAFEEYFEQDADKGKVALAFDHLRAGRKDEAIETLRDALRENADNVDAMHALAQIYWRDDKHLSDAEALLRRVTTLAPGYTAAWMMLGALLHEAHRHPGSIDCFDTATRLEPTNAAAWGGLGDACAQAGEVKNSAEVYRRSLALNPDAPGVQMGYGHVLKTLGDQAGALRAYRAAIAGKPDFGEVYWSMANLKVFRFEEAEVRAMEEQVKRSDLADRADIHFRFALGKACEDVGDYEKAWHYYDTGNQRQRKKVFHDPVAFEVRHEEIIEVFSREFIDQHAGQGYESAAPIFIVGLPRSGSTLIEQILASHSQVEGTAELPTLGQLAASIGRYRRDNLQYPRAVLELRTKDFRAYGRQYIDETRAVRSTDKQFFTDKLPNNFSHVGLVHLILPNARIINARRHPFDSCLGGYKQLFGKGQDFTYDMMELAVYYRQYHETMRHWHRVLPGKVLDVHYEETVSDLETQVRRILAHCGLPFEESCVRFHETRRAIKTASSEQVRQPLYTSALGTWRRYEKYLGLWREEFADILEELPETVRNAGL
ncbi:MAG: sulfotransferase family protein [Gammaproteobacteria bacterium]|nr:sulfotransferase family protein [Gammaproteobacteria bacterium]